MRGPKHHRKIFHINFYDKQFEPSNLLLIRILIDRPVPFNWKLKLILEDVGFTFYKQPIISTYMNNYWAQLVLVTALIYI